MCYGTCCMRYTVNNMLPWSHSMEDAAHSTAHVSRSLMTCHLQLHAIAMANPCLTHDNYPHLYSHACFVLEHLSLCVCIYVHLAPYLSTYYISDYPSVRLVLLSLFLSCLTFQSSIYPIYPSSFVLSTLFFDNRVEEKAGLSGYLFRGRRVIYLPQTSSNSNGAYEFGVSANWDDSSIGIIGAV